ncbi:MAG: hypothetical protein AB1779_08610 [Candidatus Thermoplasmatota archaeon]
MKVIGIVSDDFSFYHDAIKALKNRSLPFVSLSPKQKIPKKVGVALTTEAESKKIRFSKKIIFDGDIEKTIEMAILFLNGKIFYNEIVIGIDPGRRPGVAIFGDMELVCAKQTYSIEGCVGFVKMALKIYKSKKITIKIGHGDRKNRNRIIRLLGKEAPIEVVNETRTTQHETDVKAAINIALCPGIGLKKREEKLTLREIRNIQMESRRESNGEVTISKALAEKVGKGEITMEEAIFLQRKKNVL